MSTKNGKEIHFGRKGTLTNREARLKRIAARKGRAAAKKTLLETRGGTGLRFWGKDGVEALPQPRGYYK